MTSSTTFSLEGRGLKLDTAADIEAHIAPLLSSSASQITHFNLQGNTIGVPAAEALAPHLSKLTSLQNANLADIFTSRLLSEIPAALDLLLKALLHCTHLETVDLSDNAFGFNMRAPLVHFLQRHTPLRHLILNNNGLGPEAGTLIADAIAALATAKNEAAANVPLETIVCGRNRLENGSMPAWARAIAVHAKGLKHVRMVQNGIRQEGIQVLLRSGLREAKALETLDLQDNTFTKPGAQALAEVVGGWNALSVLGVGDCLLGSRGMVLVGEALAKGKNEAIEVLRLQYNEIDARGVRALNIAIEAGALPKLRRVELNGNKFAEEDAAIETLRETLEERKGDATGEDHYGLDDLSDLEEDDDDEEDEDNEEDEDATTEKKAEREVEQTEQAEQENVPQEKDKDVDDLANMLGKATISK